MKQGGLFTPSLPWYRLGDDWQVNARALDRGSQQHRGGDTTFTVSAERLAEDRGDEGPLDEVAVHGFFVALIPHRAVAADDCTSTQDHRVSEWHALDVTGDDECARCPNFGV